MNRKWQSHRRTNPLLSFVLPVSLLGFTTLIGILILINYAIAQAH